MVPSIQCITSLKAGEHACLKAAVVDKLRIEMCYLVYTLLTGLIMVNILYLAF